MSVVDIDKCGKMGTSYREGGGGERVWNWHWGKLKRNMMAWTSEKKKVHLVESKQRCRERAALPVRRTSCIFERPVTRITSHPGSGTRCNQWDKTLEKPQQICAYRRLQGLQACSSDGEMLSTLDFTSTLQVVALGGVGGAGSLPGRPEFCTAPSSGWAGTVPGVGFCPPPLVYRQPVTLGDIWRQTQKVRKARDRLAEALGADRLAREAERARSQEGCSDN
ncbi:methyl-CpG-binding domain protein 3-like 2B [Herpailurus yagouaroundi]|uniref:methyl-CpG-binding domain protein 3-like 2B n=1 Tax=Herpailurus yagouaroundi TaxID=1608482 RepID=UPI001AD71A5B|nr:methyl-CpG-binding domain protein 3-like 2B [Puma yagouaroundi]